MEAIAEQGDSLRPWAGAARLRSERHGPQPRREAPPRVLLSQGEGRGSVPDHTEGGAGAVWHGQPAGVAFIDQPHRRHRQ